MAHLIVALWACLLAGAPTHYTGQGPVLGHGIGTKDGLGTVSTSEQLILILSILFHTPLKDTVPHFILARAVA